MQLLKWPAILVVILAIAQIIGITNVSWWWITAPLWIPIGAWTITMLYLVVWLYYRLNRKD